MGHAKPPAHAPKRRNIVGDALRAAREKKGLSQAQTAAKLQLLGWDVGRTTWTKIELGERAVTDCELIAAARVLDVNLDALSVEANMGALREVLGSLAR